MTDNNLVSLEELYENIWTLADKLAERETQEAEKIPPPRFDTTTDSKGKEVRLPVPWIRQDYKDDARLGHIMNMMELLLNKDKTDGN